MRPAPLLLAAATIAACAACTDVDTSPIPPSSNSTTSSTSAGTPTTSDTSAGAPATTPTSSRSQPAPGKQWSGLSAKCPRLTSAAARRLGVAGDGSPTDAYGTAPGVTNADCHWGSSDGRGNAVNARVSIWENLEAAHAQWQTLTTGQSTKLDVAEEAFIADEPNAVAVRARWGNVVATIRLVPPTGSGSGRLATLRQDATDITNDIFDDLKPS